jgi:mono/diheme cytochrome c family protein
MKRLLPLALLALLLTACSLAADVTPPPGYKTPTPRPTDPPLQGPLYPAEPPSPARGAVIYATECAPCHGETGLGDGPQAGTLRDQNIPVPALGLPEYARLGSPERWYSVVTQGNLKRFMPPFRSLSDAQRWDVVAYALTLSSTPQDVAAGQSLYEVHCAECHVAGKEVVFTDQARMSKLTAAMIADTIVNGKGKMQALADFSETELAQLTAYVRSLSFDNTAAVAQATAEPAVSVTGSGQVSGSVTSSGDFTIPAGLTVTLYAFEQMDAHPVLAFTLTTQTTPGGAFSFAEVPWQAGQVLGAAVEFQNVLYGSQAADVTGSESVIALAIQAYAVTQELAGLVVDRHHIIFNFDTPGTVSVMEMYAISNPGAKTVAASAPGQAVITFPLPDGAANLLLESGELDDRFLSVPGGFADTEPVYPGSGVYQVSFQYTLPYGTGLEFSQPIYLTTEALTVLLPEGGLNLTSDRLTDGGVFQGMPFRRFDAAGLLPGEAVTFAISGQPETTTTSAAPADQTPATARRDLAIGLGALGAVLIAIGGWFYLRTRGAAPVTPAAPVQPEPALADAETLMDAIIALDDQYRTGQIPEDAYLRRRAELKELLAVAMGARGRGSKGAGELG